MKIDIERNDELANNAIHASNENLQYADHATPERLRKGSEFCIVSGIQRVLGPLSALRRSGEIDDAHVAAASRWYRDYVMGVEGVHDPDAGSSGAAGDVHAAMLARLAACTRHREVWQALGVCAELRLRLLLVDELSFSAIAEQLLPNDGNGRKKIAAQTVFLLEQLAEHYATIDRARLPSRKRTESGSPRFRMEKAPAVRNDKETS